MAKLIGKFKTEVRPPAGGYYGTIIDDKDIVSTDPAYTPVLAPTTDYRKSALQNSEHDNWRDAYSEYSGKNGSWRERRNFRKDWKNESNVKARVGENTYNQLRAAAEQEQFGSLGYNPDDNNTLTREERRFDRRFNRRLRNGKFDSNLTKSQPASSASPTNDYSFQRPLLFNMTVPVFRTAYSFGSYNPPTDPKPEQPENPEQPEQPIDYNKAGIELLGSDYMNSDNLTKIQQFLVDKNYDLGTYGAGDNGVDGKYGQKTHEALLKYLEANPQGRGWADIHALFKPAGGGTSAGGVNPGAQIPAGGTEGGGGANPPTALVTQTPSTDGATPTANIQNQFNFDNFVNEQNLPGNNIISKNGHKYVRFDPRGSGDFYVGDDGNIYSAGMFGILGNITDGTNTYEHGKKYRDNYNYLYNLINPVPKQKQGGKMNRIKYFQQGGQMQQQDVQQQIIQLVQAAMQGDQKATETINKVMEAAKAGDQQAAQLAQMIQQIVEQMQGQATVAKWGSKLRYIRSLKYAKGGKTCPSCQNGGVPANTPSKKINKKVEEKACGGKAKKKYFGGYIN